MRGREPALRPRTLAAAGPGSAAGAILVGWTLSLGAPGPAAASSGPDAPAGSAARDTATFDAGRASFRVAYRDIEVPYRVFLLQALPGDTVRIRVPRPGGAGPRDARRPPYSLEADAGTVERRGPRSWRWVAPREAGRHLRLVVRESSSGDSVVLNTFVLVPARRIRDGRLEGYRLGTFPTPAYRGLSRYRPPRGYIRLTPERAGVPVSPHFTLGQFPCKRPRVYPKFLPLGPKMLLKLERMLQELNAEGIRATGFRVMSAYRSPWYNTRLLGRPRYSRHIYGDAADVFVDEDGDGYMDDLNGDGRITVRDAEVLFRIADRIDRGGGGNALTGGLWKYRKTSNHPPFVHVDTRGFVAR